MSDYGIEPGFYRSSCAEMLLITKVTPKFITYTSFYIKDDTEEKLFCKDNDYGLCKHKVFEKYDEIYWKTIGRIYWIKSDRYQTIYKHEDEDSREIVII